MASLGHANFVEVPVDREHRLPGIILKRSVLMPGSKRCGDFEKKARKGARFEVAESGEDEDEVATLEMSLQSSPCLLPAIGKEFVGIDRQGLSITTKVSSYVFFRGGIGFSFRCDREADLETPILFEAGA